MVVEAHRERPKWRQPSASPKPALGRYVGSRRLWLALLVLAGCGDRGLSPQVNHASNASEPRPSVALRVLVVNEPKLAEATNRLRGEWTEREGGTLTAESRPWTDVAKAAALDADVIIFPSRYTGELCVRNRLRPVRKNVLEGADFNAADIYPVIRRDLIKWGHSVVALPLGVDVSMSIEPLDRRPAIAFLAYAASDAQSNERLGVLFDEETMKPRIAEPHFVDALRQLTKLRGGENRLMPAGAADEPDVPVIGYCDRLAGVTTASRNAASAFELLAWMAGPEVSSQLARAVNDTMPVRRSLASSPMWYDRRLTSAERSEMGKRLSAALSVQNGFIMPRIPGIDEYVAALDESVKSSVIGGVEPQQALQDAAAKWEQITAAHGRENQRLAYLKHLGID